MWRLPVLSKDKEEKYKAIIKGKILKLKKTKREKEVLPKNIIEKAELFEILTTIPSPSQEPPIKYKKNIKKIFNYERIISGNTAYEIAELIGVNTCVYCNRQYTFTVRKQDNKENVIRPEFDHYLPKSDHPFFALSLYNLIPSCHICNSNLKGKKQLPENLNPYSNIDKDEFFKFSYIPDERGYPKSVIVRDINPLYKTDVEKFLKIFKIQHVYSAHSKFELKEIYEFATKYSDTYLQQLLAQLQGDMQFSKEDAYRMLFGSELQSDKDNNRPLSKLKRDILEELGVI